MAKYDPPRELKEFHSHFERLGRKYDTVNTFCDFIDLMLCFFRFEGDKELGDKLKKKYKSDYEQLCVCFQKMLKAYEAGVGKLSEYDWYDGLGSYYEVITSSYKSSRLGQFFTPPEICDVMSMITIMDREKNTGEKLTGKYLQEPCAGSGRMVLSMNKVAPGNYICATDIDPVCVKMCAINMCLHGIRGQVVCADALQYGETWRFGYEINRDLRLLGFPSLHDISQEQCRQTAAHQHAILKFAERISTEQPKQEVVPVKKVAETMQLSLF